MPLRKTDAKSKTAKTPKQKPNTSKFDRDTCDEEEDVSGSLSEADTEAGDEDPQMEPGDEEIAGGVKIGDRTRRNRQEVRTTIISTEASHILDNNLTKTRDEEILAGTETKTNKTTELIPNNFSDGRLENLRKAVNEANALKAMP